MTPNLATGYKRTLGKTQTYKDRTQRVEIWFGKSQPVPYLLGVAVPVKFEFKGRVYDGKLRATERAPRVWLSPTLRDETGRIRLADVLRPVPMNAALDFDVMGQHLKVVAIYGPRRKARRRRIRSPVQGAGVFNGGH